MLNWSILIFLCILIHPYKARNNKLKKMQKKKIMGRHEKNCFEIRRKCSLHIIGLALEMCKVQVLFLNECYTLK